MKKLNLIRIRQLNYLHRLAADLESWEKFAERSAASVWQQV